jgi:hypothetical protein
MVFIRARNAPWFVKIFTATECILTVSSGPGLLLLLLLLMTSLQLN